LEIHRLLKKVQLKIFEILVLIRLISCTSEICFSISFILLILSHIQNHSFKNRETKYKKNIRAGLAKGIFMLKYLATDVVHIDTN